MSTCLGLYIEENIIKYAKVTKEHDNIKIETFGTKFYDNLDQAIKQIVEETFSYKTPISTNLTEENYNYFQVFALLSKKDLPRAIKTEFEAYCSEKNYNPNVFETRYAITPNTQQKDKLKVIHVSDNKIELNKKIQKLNSYNLQNIEPISMTIANIKKFDERENSLIVNIEEKTVITTILDQKIYDIKKLDIGSQDILDRINIKENSYKKAYEICKETTIYTSEGKELSDVETSYLEDIMPTLYDIVGQVRKIINESMDKIDKVYITGTGSLINNIDLYFEEYLENVKCEILRPNFIKMSSEINIKDYIEVNTAVSLALSGLGEGITGMNFKKTSLSEKLKELSNIDIGKKNQNTKDRKESKFNFNFLKNDLNIPLDNVEKNLIRTVAGLLILFIVYFGFSHLLENQIDKKMIEAEESIKNTNLQINNINSDEDKIQTKISDYTSRIEEINKIKGENEERTRTRKAIPILLNKLMYIMPENVQITSIQNTSGSHIEIQAQSNVYNELGYLTANIQVAGILTNTISTAGQKENNIITIKIEGDLP